MDIETQIRELAEHYAAEFNRNVQERTIELEADDKSHYLVYKVLGISDEDGAAIDLYQNKGRFLYRYAGAFLEAATKLCMQTRQDFRLRYSKRVTTVQILSF